MNFKQKLMIFISIAMFNYCHGNKNTQPTRLESFLATLNTSKNQETLEFQTFEEFENEEKFENLQQYDDTGVSLIKNDKPYLLKKIMEYLQAKDQREQNRHKEMNRIKAQRDAAKRNNK